MLSFIQKEKDENNFVNLILGVKMTRTFRKRKENFLDLWREIIDL